MLKSCFSQNKEIKTNNHTQFVLDEGLGLRNMFLRGWEEGGSVERAEEIVGVGGRVVRGV